MSLLKRVCLVCLYGICMHTHTLYAQVDAAVCKEQLKECIDDMQVLYTDSSKAMYMYFKSMSVDAETKQLQKSEVKYYKYNQFTVIASEASSYYADNKDAFMVVPLQKQVYQLDLQQTGKVNTAPTDILRTKIIDSAQVESCTVLKENTKKILLALSPSMSRTFHISKIEYVWNSVEKTMASYTVYYIPGSPLDYLKYDFVVINQQPVLPFKANSVHDAFLTGANKLLPAYSNYQYIDLRKVK